jgi:hypothetical protein
MNKLVYLLGAAVCMAGWSPSAEAQTASPLIEALVKKGVLTRLSQLAASAKAEGR